MITCGGGELCRWKRLLLRSYQKRLVVRGANHKSQVPMYGHFVECVEGQDGLLHEAVVVKLRNSLTGGFHRERDGAAVAWDDNRQLLQRP